MSTTIATTPSAPSSHPGRATVAAATASGAVAKLTLSCPATSSAACRVTAKMTAIETHKVIAIVGYKTIKHTVVVGTASATILPGTKRTVTISLTPAAKKLLKSAHRLSARLTATQNGKSLTKRSLTLSATKSKRK